MTNSGYLYYKWFVRENDSSDGWCVMPKDEPPSLGIRPVAEGLTKECAQHIVALHNSWFDYVQSENFGRPFD